MSDHGGVSESSTLLPRSVPPLHPEWWFTESRMQLNLATSIFTPLVTLVVCYGRWLSWGCAPFLPFISDLGMQTGAPYLFTAGLVASSILFLMLLVDIVTIRSQIMLEYGSGCFWKASNIGLMLAGLLIIAGLALVGFFPWNGDDLSNHLLCAAAVMIGGPTFMVVNALTTCYFGLYLRCGGSWPRMLIFQGAMCFFLLLSCGAGLAVATFVLDDIHKYVSLLSSAYDDFKGYCEPLSDRMSDTLINSLAVCEWSIALSLIASLSTACVDIDNYVGLRHQAVCSDKMPC